MAEPFSREYFVEQGRKGGMKTKRKYGKKHFSQISSLGNKALAGKRKKKKIVEN